MSDAFVTAAWLSIAVGLSVPAYAYLGYPAVLYVMALIRRAPARREEAPAWPTVSITVPLFNEEHTIAGTLDSLLALDYPRESVQILIVSDASTDNTDQIVREHAAAGVELEMDEHLVTADSPLRSKSLREAQLPSRAEVTVVAIRRSDGTAVYNPGPEEKVEQDDTLIMIGRAGASKRLEKLHLT